MGKKLRTNHEKNTYKPGDVIIARYNAPYSFTGAGTVCIVEDVRQDTIIVNPYNPFEGKRISAKGVKGDMEVDPQFFMHFYQQTEKTAMDKKWGKLGKLLLSAVTLIKALLKLLKKKAVTGKEKEDMEGQIKNFFNEVKKELGDPEKKSKGKGDAQEEKKPSEEGGGSGEGNDKEGGSKSGKGSRKGGEPSGEDASDGHSPGGDEKESGYEDGDDFKKLKEYIKNKEKKAAELAEKAQQRILTDEEEREIVEAMKEAKKAMEMLGKAEKEEDAEGAGGKVVMEGGGGAGASTSMAPPKETEGGKDKVFCGVCNRHHTRGTHD